MTALTAIELLLAKRIGLDVASTGSELIHRSVQARMQAVQFLDAGLYARLVETDEAELRALIELVVVSESWFFRDLRPFLRLQAFVRDEWLPRGLPRLRVLSIPCARGEEAYSLVIALLDAGLSPQQFTVDAVDLSERVLQEAKTGIFRAMAFRKELIGNPAHYLTQSPDGFSIRPEIRERVRFRQGNLLDPDLLADEPEYDAIFCRNVLIYLTPVAKETAI
jgi:chemotaxis protein methyltransferase WspC